MKSKPEYLTKTIAADRLGLSGRRVLELANAGKIRKTRVVDPKTGRDQTVFLASDVMRLAVARNDASATNTALMVRPNVRPARTSAALPPVEAPARQWLTLAEAADYTGLPASFLARMIADGRLQALDVGVRPGGKWRVSRRALDAIA